MTLEEKAEEKAEKYSEAFIEKGVAKASYAKGYIAGATEVTKELQEENERLVNDYEMIHNCFLIKENEVKKLEAQIEKMKSCGNCKYCGTPCTHPSEEACEDLDKWELAG